MSAKRNKKSRNKPDWHARSNSILDQEWAAAQKLHQAALLLLDRVLKSPNHLPSLKNIARLLKLSSSMGRLAAEEAIAAAEPLPWPVLTAAFRQKVKSDLAEIDRFNAQHPQKADPDPPAPQADPDTPAPDAPPLSVNADITPMSQTSKP